jgi:hypothetical protein
MSGQRAPRCPVCWRTQRWHQPLAVPSHPALIAATRMRTNGTSLRHARLRLAAPDRVLRLPGRALAAPADIRVTDDETTTTDERVDA